MSDWEAYVGRIAELDSVRREAAATVAAQELSVRAARGELGDIRQRIGRQRDRLTDVAAQLSRPMPQVEPLEDERGAASAVVSSVTSDPTPGINAALQGVRATLDAADATLAVATRPPERAGPLPAWPPAARNALVYGWYAVLATIALIVIHATAGSGSDSGRASQAGVVETFLAVAVPVGAWFAGVGSVLLLFGRAGRGGGGDGAAGRVRHPKHLLLGVGICAVPALVGLYLSVR